MVRLLSSYPLLGTSIVQKLQGYLGGNRLSLAATNDEIAMYQTTSPISVVNNAGVDSSRCFQFYALASLNVQCISDLRCQPLMTTRGQTIQKGYRLNCPPLDAAVPERGGGCNSRSKYEMDCGGRGPSRLRGSRRGKITLSRSLHTWGGLETTRLFELASP